MKLVMGLILFFAPQLVAPAIAYGGAAEPQRRAPSRRPASRPATQSARIDYSSLSHVTHVTKEKLGCDTCHKFPSKNWNEVRTGADAFPDVTEYPDHQSCLNCHRQQFFARERPAPKICYNCHFNATPVETSRYPFPSLGQKFLSSAKAADFVSDFQVYFPHDKHLDVVSKKFNRGSGDSEVFVRASFGRRFPRSQDSDPKSCSVCHKTHQPQEKSDFEFVTKPPKDLGDSFWLKKGTFKSRPITHADCFSCHNQESELAPLPQNCDACHKLPGAKPEADFDPQLATKIGSDDWWSQTAWRDRLSSGTFRHEVHSEQACTKCHNVNAMNTLDPGTLKVGITSCGGAEGCHVTATADDGGILNYEIDQRKSNNQFTCVKCHIVFGTRPFPASHLEAIAKAAAK